MDNHARHAAESHRIHLERMANVIPGSPLDDRVRAEGATFPPEIEANRGLFSDSGGACDE